LASSRHLETICFPLFDRHRTFLGDAEPLNAVRDRCNTRNTAAIERLERQIDELKQQHQCQIDGLKRESKRRVDELQHHQRQIDGLKRKLTLQKRESKGQSDELKQQHQRQIDGLKCDLAVLLNSKQMIICREIVVCVYDALGHNPNNPRQITFQYIRDNPNILKDAFRISPNDIQKVLDALNPRPNQSWIKRGNGETHGFSVAGADRFIDDEAIRILFNALTQEVKDLSTTIQDASLAVHNALVRRIPAVNEISSLSNPNNGGTASSAEVERVVQECLGRLLPGILQASRPIPPPPGVDPETYRSVGF